MTLQEKLQSKLQPHADRVKDGNNDEFDYLPAVLLHLIEEQKKQSQTNAESVSQARKLAANDIQSVINFINKANGDVKNGADEITRLVSQTQADLQEKIAFSSKLAIDDRQIVVKLLNQIRDDAKKMQMQLLGTKPN